MERLVASPVSFSMARFTARDNIDDYCYCCFTIDEGAALSAKRLTVGRDTSSVKEMMPQTRATILCGFQGQ